MTFKLIVLFCLQALLLKDAFGLPSILNTGLNTVTPIATGVVPSSVLTGTVAQAVSPSFTPNWPASAAAVPLVTEIVPNLQFGEINVDGDMPVNGMIKISGTFPVFGNVAVDGSVPSYGTAYVDTANVFQNDCACF